MNNICFDFSFRKGFTLIELLIVIAIILLTVGGGIAGFISFNDRQTVLEEVKLLKTDFSTAKGKVNAGEIPVGCVGRLSSYSVRYNSALCTGNQVCLVAVCDNGASEVMVYTREVSSSIEINSLSESVWDFLVLGGGVESDDLGDISVALNNDLIYTFQISKGGETSEGAWQ
jgi:prepilin-type N-terminal cleavage/methylation domain-containing protein